MGNYTASWIVKFCHSFPHINFQLTLVDEEDYGFDNNAYLESLAVIALMVIVWFLITLVFFVIYFCCLKGSSVKDVKSNGSGCYCSLCVLAIFIMLTLGAIGAALYGNMQTTDGVEAAADSVKVGNDTFYALKTEVSKLDAESTKFRDLVADLKNIRSFDEDVAKLEEVAYDTIDAVTPFADQLHGVEDRLAWSIDVLVLGEKYRNIATLCLIGFQCLVCFLGFLGLCCRSKCILIFMIVTGMICITSTYFYLAVELVADMAAADFCIQPYVSIYNQTVDKSYMDEDAADYFLKCKGPNPFEEEIVEGKKLLQNAVSFVDSMGETANSTDEKEILFLIRDIIDTFVSNLDELESKLDCTMVKSALDQFIPAVCFTTVDGLFALSAAMFGIGLLMSVALCAAAKTGQRFGRRDRDPDLDDDLDFSDPFLPRTTNFTSRSNRNSNITRTNNPIYATTASSNSNYGAATNTLSFFRPGSDEDVSLLENPPPYSPPRPGGSRLGN